ncbi:hypothetical protein P8625_02045 [Tenacibaculum tangerinum]|uniref:Nitrogen fixation protein NifH n=1 Tax=Tenacibaculum tangerinum TaxID=3038772 RepID=A0ABY8L3F7_9FLAO|nr:hypothetical protein [Tenacibaculum tangerinum]WGH75971.1 hypothetical protein P8625_02045 [Tenacibaculum tangerinum]
MDKALELKIKFKNNEITNFREAEQYLNNSDLFKSLLTDFDYSVLNLLWRLTQLAEIPFSNNYSIVAEWTEKLINETFTGEGFSLNGKNDYLLACYNGMITSILIKLNHYDKDKIRKGINWIKNYQNVKRGEKCDWKGTGLKKYGGCMKSTPCYIGLVKSMIALSDYKNSIDYRTDNNLEIKLEEGLNYILNQKIFLRISNNKPITKDITKLTYPFTWKINIIEILRLIKDNQMLNDSRCSIAQEYLKSKRKDDGFWWCQTSNIMKNKSWIRFDKPREKGLWISNEIEQLL